jgi:hypothetical protein
MKKIFIICLLVMLVSCKNTNKIKQLYTPYENNNYNIKVYSEEEIEISILRNNNNYAEFEKSFRVSRQLDIKFLMNIPQIVLNEYIEKLYITLFSYGNNRIENLDFIMNLPHLKELIISSVGEVCSLENIDPIKYLINLEYLQLYRTYIYDLSIISELNNLKHLHISNVEHIKDISFINKVNKLKILKIATHNDIDNIEIIFENINIEILSISSKIDQIKFNNITKLTNLEELEINISSIDDLTPLLELPNLKYINFRYSEFIQDINDKKLSLFLPLASSNSLERIFIIKI